MAHHQLDGCGFGWTLGGGDGQGGLVCCSSWGCKESDTTERLNRTEQLINSYMISQLYVYVCVCVHAHACLVTQSCPALCDTMNHRPPGSFVHGILQAKISEWVLQGIFPTQG